MNSSQSCTTEQVDKQITHKTSKNKDMRGFKLQHDKIDQQPSQKFRKSAPKAKKLQKIKAKRNNSNSLKTLVPKKTLKKTMQKQKSQNHITKMNGRSESNQDVNVNKQLLENCNEIVNQNKLLKKKIEDLSKQIKRQNLDIQKNEFHFQEDSNQIKTLMKQNEILKKKNEQLNRELTQLKRNDVEKDIQRSEEIFLQKENKNLKNEIKILFNMLKKTQEYKDFSYFADIDGNLRYLQSMGLLNNAEKQKKNLKKFKKHNCLEPQMNPENEQWVPENCYLLLKDLQKKEFTLTDQCIDYILYQLNKLWSQREKKIIQKAFIFCKNCQNKNLKRNQEITKLLPNEKKDQIISKLRYDNHELKEKIKCLKQINSSNYENPYSQKNIHQKQLSENLQFHTKQANFSKQLEYKNKFLLQSNKMLTKMFQQDNLREFYQMQGVIDNNKLVQNFFGKMKKNLQEQIQKIYEENAKQMPLSDHQQQNLQQQYNFKNDMKKDFNKMETILQNKQIKEEKKMKQFLKNLNDQLSQF